MGIKAVSPHPLPTLYVELGFGLLPALLDSGAARSMISVSAYDRLKQAAPFVQVTPINVNCITAARQSFPVSTAVTCKIRIDRYTWKFTFYVVENLACPVILGSDFLGKTGLLMTFVMVLLTLNLTQLISCPCFRIKLTYMCLEFVHLQKSVQTCPILLPHCLSRSYR
jgi:hypothetical protein